LLPAAIYLVAAIGYARRLPRAGAYLDRALYLAAALNFLCHLTMSASRHVLDAPYSVSHFLMVMSYVLVLGGTLLDNAKLFDEVSHMAASDSLTGLANHRRMIEVIENEIQRSGRTGRSFALLLFDLDGLKKINDRFGHLVGSAAIKRVAIVLQGRSRAIDTAARYGGDEFALVLPESTEEDAQQAGQRICEALAQDGQAPLLSVSVGLSVYPKDGTSIEKLLAAADSALYGMKNRGPKQKKFRFTHVAACL
jgi:diguanylate cyclase (GGDEF)-like protein